MRGWTLPAWAMRLLAAFAIGFAAFRTVMSMGRQQGQAEARAKRAEANLKAARDAKETRHEMETSDDQRLVDILTGMHGRKR
jgi:hypothetical protein